MVTTVSLTSAAQALGDVLRVELNNFGASVSLVEPAYVRTVSPSPSRVAYPPPCLGRPMSEAPLY
jgi:hypothetical protein